jgi:hypothetical protein
MKDRKKVEVVREKLEKIINGSYNEDDVQELIKCLYHILYSIVRNFRTRAIEKGGYGKEDVVNIALSTFFEEDKEEKYSTLKRLFAPFVKSNCSIREFSDYLHAILIKRIKEALTKLLHEVYPVQTKLRISFFNFLKNSEDLKFEKRGSDIIIWLKDSPLSLPPLSYGAVLSECISLMLWNKKPSSFLAEFFNYLRARNIYNPVYLRDVIDVYITLNPIKIFDKENAKSKNNFFDVDSTEELIEDLIRKIEEENRELVNGYVKKRKISETQGEAFIKAVNDIIYDWLHAIKECSFYRYLSFYTNEIDFFSYRREKRKILEYLVKRSKKLIKEKILSLF